MRCNQSKCGYTRRDSTAVDNGSETNNSTFRVFGTRCQEPQSILIPTSICLFAFGTPESIRRCVDARRATTGIADACFCHHMGAMVLHLNERRALESGTDADSEFQGFNWLLRVLEPSGKVSQSMREQTGDSLYQW